MTVNFSDSRASAALNEAEKARERAYEPYSGFKLGAAMVTDENEVILGALVENISPRTGGAVTRPCGACLQVDLELGGPDLLAVVSNGSGEPRESRRRELAGRLPYRGQR